jgi:SAM-dependent methyltransferase
MTAPSDPTARFTERVADYAAHRPSYPAEMIGRLAREGVLRPADVVADVGSGTGILTALLLDHGHTVYAVEPNAAMASEAAARLGGNPRFHAVAGRAEATGLADASCDAVTAAQAFHWFEIDAARREFARILRPGGPVVLLWNIRRLDATPFLREYEDLVQRFAIDYEKISAGWADEEAIARFFAPSSFEVRGLEYRQAFGFEGLRGRLLSSSYAPPAGHPRHEPMIAELRQLFDRHQRGGEVAFEYDTRVYWGRLG